MKINSKLFAILTTSLMLFLGLVACETESSSEPPVPDVIVTFKDGDSTLKTLTGKAGGPLTSPVAPVKTGYSFSGWEPALPKTFPDADAVYKAKWTAISYVVRFDANGGTGEMNEQSFTFDMAAKLSKNTFVKLGYYFIGWARSSDPTKEYEDESEVFNLSDENDSIVTLYAVWHREGDYEITYNLNGGTNGGNPAFYNVDDDTIIFSPATKTGYTFGGWYSDADFTTEITQIENGTTGKIELWAKWTTISYSVRFDANGGTGEMSEQIFTYDKAEKLSKNMFVKTGYYFIGWARSSDSTDEYEDESEVANLTTENNSIITLYAVWLRDGDYKITYNLNGGTNGGNPASYNVDDDTIRFSPATKTGYTFDGWYSDADFTTGITEIVKGSTGKIELWAKWMPISYLVKFDANGGTGEMSDQIFTYDSTEKLSKNTFIKTGYYFIGWAKSLDSTKEEYEDESEILNLANENNVTITFYAVWEREDNYKITYNLDGGTNGENPASYNVDDETITLKDATKTGYIFGGWYGDADFTTEITEIVKGSTGKIELWAKWEPIIVNYTVKHWKENLDDDEYTLCETETNTGYTDSMTSPVAKDYEHFIVQEINEKVIAGDGSTIVDVYYNLKRITLTFDPNDGDWNGSTAPMTITEKYGAKPKRPPSPKKSGYGYRWEPNIEEALVDKTYTANWFSFSGELTSSNIRDVIPDYDEKTVKYIEVPDYVTSIGNYTFKDCTSLTSIEIPESLTYIGSNAFKGCTSLTSIEIPESLTYIGSSAFYDCKSLMSIEIPESVTSIGSSAFEGCTSLTSINIPNGVTSIGEYAFRDCTSLTSIEIPKSVTSIGKYAFYRCSKLTEAIFKTTTGWTYSSSENGTNASPIRSEDLSNSNTAATFLTSTYNNYYWFRSN